MQEILQGNVRRVFTILGTFLLFPLLVEELVPRGSRPARPVSVPAPEMRERTDSGSHTASPGKSLKALSNPLKGKLMTRPRTRSKVDYDELAQVIITG